MNQEAGALAKKVRRTWVWYTGIFTSLLRSLRLNQTFDAVSISPNNTAGNSIVHDTCVTQTQERILFGGLYYSHVEYVDNLQSILRTNERYQ